MLIKAWQSGLTAAALFMLAVTVVALVAFAVAPAVREGWRKWRKRASAGVAVAASAFAIIYGGSKGVNAGADEGIALVGVTVAYDATNDVTSVAVAWTNGTVTTATPVSVRNAESEQWRELVKIGAAIETGATNVLSFTVAGDESAHGFWWVGFDTPAVIVETAGITITNFVATSKSVSIAWTCDATNQQYFTVQRKHPADAEWQSVSGIGTNMVFAFSGFTVGETWMWRVIGRETIYDAEVEYLESTGTQYIKTGFTATDSMSYKCVFSPTSLAYNCGFFGYRFTVAATAYGNMRFLFIYNDGRIGLRNGLDIQNSTRKLAIGSIYDLEVDNQYVKVDGNVWISADNKKAAMNPPGEAWLFFVNCTGHYNADVQHPASARLYAFQIFDNGTLVRDFIPVRTTTARGLREGAMYDRGTGQLFRNAGTGSFRYGSDK